MHANLLSTSVSMSRSMSHRPPAFTSVRPKASSTRRMQICHARIKHQDVVLPDLSSVLQTAGTCLFGLAAALLVTQATPAEAAIRLPPIDRDPKRCERAFVGNTIGQANAVSDRVLDLRECDLAKADLAGKTLSGALLVDASLQGANLQEAVLSKAYAVGTNFSGADLTNAVVDRVVFQRANLSGAVLKNAIITGSTFEGANLEGAVFEEALIGSEDAKRLCANPTLVGSSRVEVGCRK